MKSSEVKEQGNMESGKVGFTFVTFDAIIVRMIALLRRLFRRNRNGSVVCERYGKEAFFFY